MDEIPRRPSGRRARWLCALALAAASSFAYGNQSVHRHLLEADPQRTSLARSPWTATTSNRLALTYRSLAADVAYLQAISLYGSSPAHRDGYPQLAPLLKRASGLDPRFAAPYLLAGTALTVAGMDNEAALALLERGSAARPDVWRISFYYAFELMERGRYRAAAQAMAGAAAQTGAPFHLTSLAARLASEGHDPAVALALVDTLRARATTEEETRALDERRDQLLFEKGLVGWQQAGRAFYARHGRVPRDGQEAAADALPDLPLADPWGAPYGFEGDGRATSDHIDRRLRLHRPGDQTEGP